MGELIWFWMSWIYTRTMLLMSLIIWWHSSSSTGFSPQMNCIAARAGTLGDTWLVSVQGHRGACGVGGIEGLVDFPAPLARSGNSSPGSCAGRRRRGLVLSCSSRGQIITVGTSSGINLDRWNKARSETWSTQNSWPVVQVPLPLPKEKKKEKSWVLFFLWKRSFQIHLQHTEPFILEAIKSNNSPEM